MSDTPFPPDDATSYFPSEDTMQAAASSRGERLRAGDVLLGRYTVLSDLGEGGMGVVYRCLDSVGCIEVAIKCLPPELSRNEAEMEGIRENYAIVARLHHSSISGLRQLEKDPDNDEYYLVMDLAEGEDLSKILRSRHGAPMPLSEALSLLHPLASALDYAHGEKILHRDVKPENVKVLRSAVYGGAPRVQLLDFGLAAEVRSSLTRVTRSRRGHFGTSGTPSYMAPEQWEARPQSPATDQYALAVVAYQMLAGHLPFAADDPDILRRAVLSRAADPVPGLPRRANAALLRALSKDSAARFPSCSSFVNALAAGADPHFRVRSWLVASLGVFAAVALGALLLAVDSGFEEDAAVPSVLADSVAEKNADLVSSSPRDAASAVAEESPAPAAEDTPAPAAEDALAPAAEEAPAPAAEDAPAPAAEDAPAPAAEDAPAPVAEDAPAPVPGNRASPPALDLLAAEYPALDTNPSDEEDEGGGVVEEVRLIRIDLKDGMSLDMICCSRAVPEFWMGKTEVSQAQWKAVVGNNPPNFRDPLLPVESVSWDDCTNFVARLNQLTAARDSGLVFRLPTESEWEFACRAGGKGAYCTTTNGTEITAETLGRVSWYEKNSDERTHPAGGLEPNAWGLYDMLGNVLEWTATSAGPNRVVRGGSWVSSLDHCVSSFRSDRRPSARHDCLGFRLAAIERDAIFRELVDGMVQIPGRNYLLGAREVTQDQWESVVGGNPSNFREPSHPVEKVSWIDCTNFLAKINRTAAARDSGLVFRMPTESEWRYACRAGGKGEYCMATNGTEIAAETLGRVSWYEKNSDERTHPAGGLEPNAWGLYDMLGNVLEWTATSAGTNRIFCGGSWVSSSDHCVSSFRRGCPPSSRHDCLGFRLAASRAKSENRVLHEDGSR